MALFNVSKLHKLLWLNVSLTATANIWYIALRLKAVMYVSDPFERRAIMSDKRIRMLIIFLTVLLAAGLLTCSVSALRSGAEDIGPLLSTPPGRIYNGLMVAYLLINLCAVTYIVRAHHFLPPAKGRGIFSVPGRRHGLLHPALRLHAGRKRRRDIDRPGAGRPVGRAQPAYDTGHRCGRLGLYKK